METISTYVAGRTGNCLPPNVSLRCFASSAHHIRKPSTLMTLFEQKDFIATSGWFGFICEHHALLFNDDTQLEPASLLLFTLLWTNEANTLLPTGKMLHKKKHLLSVERRFQSACIIVIFSDNQFQLIQLLSLPRTIFSSPLRLKG